MVPEPLAVQGEAGVVVEPGMAVELERLGRVTMVGLLLTPAQAAAAVKVLRVEMASMSPVTAVLEQHGLTAQPTQGVAVAALMGVVWALAVLVAAGLATTGLASQPEAVPIVAVAVAAVGD